MRITFFFPRLKTFSGAEHLLFAVAGHLQRRGHEIRVVTRGISEVCSSEMPSSVDVLTPESTVGLTGIHLVDSFLDVAHSPFLGTEEIGDSDVFCFVADPVLPALYREKRRFPEIPAVYYCLQPPRMVYDLLDETVAAHKPIGYLIPLLAPIYRRVDRSLARRADRIVALSEDYAEWCRELYDRPVDLVPAGVDLDLACSAEPGKVRERHGLPPGAPLVLIVGKLIARKNIDVFLRTMARVCAEHPEARGVVVGDGPLKQTLLRLRSKLGLEEQVIFTGHLAEFSEVANYYAACDVYVFLEKNVPFGLTVLEASISSKPVVAIEGGGTRETLVHGETGFKVDDHLDVPEIARRICLLLADEEMRRSMGRRGAEHARAFSWEACAEGLLEIFRQETS